MHRPDRSATSGGDIAVELRQVDKTFYQRQRSEKFRDVLKNLFRPRSARSPRCAGST